MVVEKKLLRYTPLCEVIDTTKYYLVDVFSRDWRSVLDAYTIFVPGGLYFIVHGINLRSMIKQCPEQIEAYCVPGKVCNKKRDVCFSHVISREEIVRLYKTLFYNKPTNTSDAFQALCQRSRNHRYQYRMKFTYKIVKALRCTICPNSRCVYDALKLFYNNDKKCEREVDYTVSREHGGI